MCRSPEALARRAAASRHRYHCPSRGCLVNRSSLTGVGASSTKSDLITALWLLHSSLSWRQYPAIALLFEVGIPPHDDVREEVAGPSRGRSHGAMGSCCRPVIALTIPRPAGLLDGFAAVFWCLVYGGVRLRQHSPALIFPIGSRCHRTTCGAI